MVIWMADKPRLATIEIVFFLAAIFFAALNVHHHLVAPISGTPLVPSQIACSLTRMRGVNRE